MEPLSSPGEPDIHLPVRLRFAEAVLFDADGKELCKVGHPLDLHARRRVRGHAARAPRRHRGRNAVEIYLLLFGYMLAHPGCVLLNRGNHESFDMNIRGFHEGGGFAEECRSKYSPEIFMLFTTVRRKHTLI